MRRFAGFLVVVMSAALIFGACCAEARDDVKKKYDCEICDNEAYKQTANRALLFVHLAGVDARHQEHALRKFTAQSGTAFVFRETSKSPARICTAWHVVEELMEWESSVFLVYPWNMRELVRAHVACYNEEIDIAILDFDDPDAYKGGVLDLGDDEKLSENDKVSTMGAPEGHLFVRSAGTFLSRVRTNGNPRIRLMHSALTAPGMSGGPFLDQTDRVIGVNISHISEDHKEYANASIAARVSDLRAMLEDERKMRREEKGDEEKK